MSPQPNPPIKEIIDWHFKISMTKSCLRLIGCGALFFKCIMGAAVLLFLAEILGIVEELQ